MFEIKTHCCGAVICTGVDARAAVVLAVRGEVSLVYADLRGQTLRDLDLTAVDLSYAKFDRAVLDGSSFRGADLSYASFRESSIRDCDFQWAILEDTWF